MSSDDSDQEVVVASKPTKKKSMVTKVNPDASMEIPYDVDDVKETPAKPPTGVRGSGEKPSSKRRANNLSHLDNSVVISDKFEGGGMERQLSL